MDKVILRIWVGLAALGMSSAGAIDLTDFVADSISAHPNVREQTHVFRQAMRDREIAKSGWQPSVDLEATFSKNDTDSPITGPVPIDYSSDRLEFSITQNLFDGFDTQNRIKQTKARAQAALHQLYDIADNLALDATQAFLEAIKQKKLHALAEENLIAHESILAQIRERSNSGAGRRSELEQTEGRVARAHASLIAQQNNLQDAMTELHQILGRYIQPATLVEPSMPEHPGLTLDELIDRALYQHPAMRVANHNIDAALWEQKRTKSNYLPKVDLKVAKEIGTDLNGIPGDTDDLNIMLNLKYNFYRGGADRAEERKKISAVHEQQQFAARVRRQIINTLRLSWTADQSLSRQLKYLKQHVTKSGETVASYREEFFIGQRDLINLLDAKNELNSAKNRYAEAYFEAIAARFRIHEGIGALFPVLRLETKVTDDNLQISRIYAQGEDTLPLNPDFDIDNEVDAQDHCDNTLLSSKVNQYGCFKSQPIKLGYKSKNSAPIAVDDFWELDQNGVLVINQSMLLKNDSDTDGDTLSLVDFTQPVNGKLARDRRKNLIYRAAEGFVGEDTFTYTISDSKGSVAKANVVIFIPKNGRVDLSKTQYVNFLFGKSELTPESYIKMQQIYNELKKIPNVEIDVYTYTDNIGSDKFNLALSERRAAAMRALLTAEGIGDNKIRSVGMGENDPIADNSTPEGQAINRRGELHFKFPDKDTPIPEQTNVILD